MSKPRIHLLLLKVDWVIGAAVAEKDLCLINFLLLRPPRKKNFYLPFALSLLLTTILLLLSLFSLFSSLQTFPSHYAKGKRRRRREGGHKTESSPSHFSFGSFLFTHSRGVTPSVLLPFGYPRVQSPHFPINGRTLLLLLPSLGGTHCAVKTRG